MRNRSFSFRWAIGFGCLFLLGTSSIQPAKAGTIRHDRPDSSYTSLAASYPAVGALTWGSYICSATLIDDNWILSAGHCLDEVGLSASDWTFDLSDSGGGVHVGAERFVNPGWTGELSDGTDIALLRLATSESTVTPATINTNPSEVGKTATHVGYGVTGTGLTGHTEPAGTKRAGQNVVDVDGNSVTGYSANILFEDFDSGAAGDNVFGSATQLDLEYLIAGGDSGGAVFMDFGAGEVVAGVHSFIASVDGNLDADYGDLAGSTRVSSYSSWITSTVAGNDPVAPELSSWLVWLVVVIGLLRTSFLRLANQKGAVRKILGIQHGNADHLANYDA
ncbi:S1 family peptidase [Aporhodopirellula aestuarii]|uniref:S1 family peptidase n=1 Tax=Aporhodopirellula aestuarii TaxID=2950107 RepID=A0ABT0UGK4_9BACT|nr:S1 family peptidase [Aporhodopirellula aestuarii]MCM2375131.1 S1 family peptidase [Aporhodopirellula aestuarii]